MGRDAGFSPRRPGFDPKSRSSRNRDGQSGTGGASLLRVFRVPLPILIPQRSINRGCYNRPTSDRRTKVDTSFTAPHEQKKTKQLFWGITECSPVEVHVTVVGTASIFRVEE
jgi:hypothetical protein